MASAPFKVVLLRTTHDGLDFIKSDLHALHREDRKEAKENPKARKATTESLKAKNVKKARNDEKTDHDPNHATDEILETVLRPHDETVPVGAAAQAPEGLVRLVLKHDLKSFCIFYNHGICKSSAKDCPLAHNPTCKFFTLPNGCRNGDK